MMAGVAENNFNDFKEWLTSRLQSLNADDEVFCPYILSILEEDTHEGEMTASLSDVLEGLGLDNSLADSHVESSTFLRNEIVQKWSECRAVRPEQAQQHRPENVSNLQAQLANITEMKSEAYAAAKASSKGIAVEDQDRRAVKAAIMKQYQNGEEVPGEEDGGREPKVKNANAEQVAKAEQEKREKSRAAAQLKKDRDKEDREKQKKQVEDKKKKAQEKAAKGERRR